MFKIISNTKILTIFLFILTAFSVNAQEDLITSFDYFETGKTSGGKGWSEPWSLSGSASPSVVSSDDPFESSYHMKIIDDGVAERSLSSPVSNGILSFAWKVHSLDVASDLAYVAVYDGTNWHNVLEVAGYDDSRVWSFVKIDLSPYGEVSKVRFGLSETTGPWDFFFIDAVRITGEPCLPLDTLEVANEDVRLVAGETASVNVNYNVSNDSNILVAIRNAGNVDSTSIAKSVIKVTPGCETVTFSLEIPESVAPGNDYRLVVALWNSDWSNRLDRLIILDRTIHPQASVVGKWQTIHNDFFWNDTDGRPIWTRSGDILKHEDTFYWYGAWRWDGTGLPEETGWGTQYLYTSKDLMNWERQEEPFEHTNGINRVDVEYKEATDEFVMFLKYGARFREDGTHDENSAHLGIATSPSPKGPFTLQYLSDIDGAYIGDMSIFKDDDGKVYMPYVYKMQKNGQLCTFGCSKSLHSLSDDYLSLGNRIEWWNKNGREAPVIFKHKGTYYYATSATVGVSSSDTKYYTAPNINGPWTTTLEPLPTPGDAADNTWDCQIDFVYPIKGKNRTVYLFGGDRWIYPNRDYRSQGHYLWLPLEFDENDKPVLNFYQDWEINIEAGEWRPFDYSRNLALNKPAVASSQTGDNTASKVTAETTYKNYTNYRWQSASSGDWQWIRIDLGTEQEINRVILKWHENYAQRFKVQVSNDLSSWTDVYNTEKGGARTVTDVTFERVSTRYVRMLALEPGTENGYSLFNFMVLNDKE